MVFGPSGSGKSSLIRSMFIALTNSIDVPIDVAQNIKIANLTHNEGTRRYTKIPIKKPNKNEFVIDGRKYVYDDSGINLIDTRGQILLDNNEEEKINIMMDGRVKNMSMIESRNYRYAYLLWEFWKSDYELFVDNDMNKEPDLNTKPHSIIFVFDGSLDKVPNGDEEVAFYNKILKKCQDKGYHSPQIVLTRIDKLEDQIKKLIKNGIIPKEQREAKLKEIQDKKIEDVSYKLGVPRTNVHFVENYTEKHIEVSVAINYYTIKIVDECLKECDKFIEQN